MKWLLIFILGLIGLNKAFTQVVDSYVLEEMGLVFTEVFDSTNTDENRFNGNNHIFKVGRVFTYTYEHLDPNGKKLLYIEDFDDGDWRRGWKYIPGDSKHLNAVDQFKITVLKGLGTFKDIPGYSQTLIKYEYLANGELQKMNSITGVIENEKNLWMHPPRDLYFRILQLNPFPYIQTPYKVGTKFKWGVISGSHFDDKRWRTWEGNIVTNCTYEITGKSIIETAFGKLECWVTKANATSDLGITQLITYFHPDYGFVILNYTNIDGSSTNIKLESITTR